LATTKNTTHSANRMGDFSPPSPQVKELTHFTACRARAPS
jgi:hypothetical protein